MLIAFNKPFDVICKFGPEPGRRTLAEYIDVKNVYPAGRLDTDSEGLLLLTDDGALQARQVVEHRALGEDFPSALQADKGLLGAS